MTTTRFLPSNVTEDGPDQYSRRHYGKLVRAASVAPVLELLKDFQKERPFPIVGMFPDGWERLVVEK